MSEPIDIRGLFPESCDYQTVKLPATAESVRVVRDMVFPDSQANSRLLVTSARSNEFSWELINRLVLAEPRRARADDGATVGEDVYLSRGEVALSLLPSALTEPTRLEAIRPIAAHAVVLLRKGTTRVADVEALAHLLRAAGFTVRAVVIVDGEHRRWRTWRRFARTYGVWSDPERPWPAIDVLDEEMRRTARSRRSEPGG